MAREPTISKGKLKRMGNSMDIDRIQIGKKDEKDCLK